MIPYLETELSKRMRLRVNIADANTLTFDKELREKLSDGKDKINPAEVFTYLISDKINKKSYTHVDKKDIARIIIQTNANDEEGACILEEWIKKIYGGVSKSSSVYYSLKKEIAAKSARIAHYFFDIQIY